MRVGVITTQYAPNFGALLQTYALQRLLSSIKGVDDVEVIDYYPTHAKHFWKIYSTNFDLRDQLRNIYLLMNRKIVLGKKEQQKQFQKFVQDNIKCSNRYSAEDISDTKDKYDTFICGSDQIWNFTRHDDPIWFLYFTKGWKGKRKFSYAPSVADQIPEQYIEHLKKYLDNLDLISVRESMDVQLLQEITGRNIFHACDPVFLLDVNEWEKLIPKRKIDEPYIFCYFISSGAYAAEVVKKVKKLTGLEVAYVNVNVLDRFDSKWNIRTCSPFEFLSYIKNAAYVCTNSFHCTAFSILFQKNFVVVPKATANNRMESLMKKVGMQSRFVYPDVLRSMQLADLETDYSGINFSDWIIESKEFIYKGLGMNG